MGEKAGIYTPTLPLTFGLSLSSAIKNVHTYSHTKLVEDPRTCAYMADEKKGQKGRKGGCSSRTLRGVEDPAKKKKN